MHLICFPTMLCRFRVQYLHMLLLFVLMWLYAVESDVAVYLQGFDLIGVFCYSTMRFRAVMSVLI